MATTVSVANFEGPLALLLELVSRNQLEVTAVSVGAVTKQYLERVANIENPDRHDLAQFLELGARLLYIKSMALLPSESETAPSEELQRLNQELAEYRLFKAATAHLQQRLKTGQTVHPRATVPTLTTAELPNPEIDLLELGRLFTQALQRSRPVTTAVITRQHYDQTEIAEQIWKHSAEQEISLPELLKTCRDRAEIIVTFLAILELVRSGRMTVRQSELFDSIHLARAV